MKTIYSYLHKTCIGYQTTDNYLAPYVIYIEFPDGTQISWHTTNRQLTESIGHYDRPWDGKVNSTLPKIERLILEIISEEKSK